MESRASLPSSLLEPVWVQFAALWPEQPAFDPGPSPELPPPTGSRTGPFKCTAAYATEYTAAIGICELGRWLTAGLAQQRSTTASHMVNPATSGSAEISACVKLWSDEFTG